MQDILNKIKGFSQYPQMLQLVHNYPHVGCHMSISSKFVGLIQQMKKLKATACAFITSNVRGWNVQMPNLLETSKFIQTCTEQKIGRNQFLPHAPYIINLCSESEETSIKSYSRLHYDAFVVRLLGLDRLNFHPGSSKNKATGIKTVAQVINDIHNVIPDVILVMETMAGSKADTILGNSFEELKKIIDLVDQKQRVGVCIDTQHTFAGGFVSEKLFGQSLLKEFDNVVGSQYLYGMHINGSKTEYKSGVDRHEQLEKGFIDIKHIENIMSQKRQIPHCLETPDEDQYAAEIQQLIRYSHK